MEHEVKQKAAATEGDDDGDDNKNAGDVVAEQDNENEETSTRPPRPLMLTATDGVSHLPARKVFWDLLRLSGIRDSHPSTHVRWPVP